MDAFLERMRQSGNVFLSCRAAGVPRRTIYRWRDRWSTFAAEWDEAKEDAVDKLDAEAWRRATEEASDRLLMFLLKAHKPSVYNPIQRLSHEGTGEGGALLIHYVNDWRGPIEDADD
jgi:transposase-like protein